MSDRIKSKKTIIFIIVIGVVLAAALLISNFTDFGSGGKSEIILPVQTAAVTGEPSPEISVDDGMLSISPNNVTNAISTITPPGSYHRTLQYTVNNSGSLKTTSVEVWVCDDNQRFDIDSGDGIKHVLIVDDAVQIWYNSDTEQVSSFKLSEYYTPEDLQGIPSYSDILTIDENLITDADYVAGDSSLGNLYVQYQTQEGDYVERRWISLETGLLTEARTLYGGELVYHMTQLSMELLPATDSGFEGRFTLPEALPEE